MRTVTPSNEWEWLVKRMNSCVRNTLTWREGKPLPPAPNSPCWLLPCKDDTAVEIATHQDELRALGWKLLTCQPHVVSRIGQKANLHKCVPPARPPQHATATTRHPTLARARGRAHASHTE